MSEAWNHNAALLALRELRWRNAVVEQRRDIFFLDRRLADLDETIRICMFLRDREGFEAALAAYNDYVSQRIRIAMSPR